MAGVTVRRGRWIFKFGCGTGRIRMIAFKGQITFCTANRQKRRQHVEYLCFWFLKYEVKRWE